MVFPWLDPGSTVLVDPGKALYQKEAGKKAGCSDVKGRRYEKGGIVAIVEGEAHGGLGLRGELLGVQTQSHIGTARYRQGAQGNREVEFFQVSNDGTALAQRRLKDKQPEEKTNMDCLVKDQEKEY
ncbi:hypothetical protein Tco_1536027 [Tanacetum coccineum]